jgi:hypothetical protein
MSARTTVFEMVRQVLDDSREKLASDSSGVEKQAAAHPQTHPGVQSPGVTVAGKYTVDGLSKIAQSCFYLSDNIHQVNDQRSPQEKLAEMAAAHEALTKAAFDVGKGAPPEPSQNKGEGNKGSHQTQKSNSESDPPATVGTDDSGTGVGAGNAIPSEGTNTPGESLDAGESGAAKPVHQSPKSVTPSEKPNPLDAGNALETNKEMMMADQPEAVLKQASRAERTLAKLTGKMPGTVKVAKMMQAADQTGVPRSVAQALIQKLAEDALNPAKVSSPKEPILQSAAGAPNALMQGTEAGEGTPRETAPTTGEAVGRPLVASNEAAMNATKQQAKTQNVRAAMGQLLTEKALSSANDQTLQKSLDNTSSAGVKISAARELLRKFAASNPENAQKVLALSKIAMGEVEGMEGVPPEAAAMPAPAPEAPEAPSDEALDAAKAGVTPDELAEAEQLLTAQGAQAEAVQPPGAPVEGAETPEKDSMFGAAGMGGGAPSMGMA